MISNSLVFTGIGYVREHSLFSENMSSASSINLEDPADNKCEPESRMTRSRSFRMYDIDYAEVDQQHPMIPQPKSVIPGYAHRQVPVHAHMTGADTLAM